jgi:DnaJ-class molecular chaperone
MKLLFVHEKVNANGSIERLSAPFDQEEVLIGRGGSSHLIVSGARVSLVHAKISHEAGRFSISDLNSLSGVRVNNARVGHAILSDGDVIQLGDLSFLAEIVGDLITLTLRSIDEERVSDAERIARKARKLVIDSYLPPMRVLSVISAVLVLVGCFVSPILRSTFNGWSSGPISNAHKMVERDCQQCHMTPFEQVQDRECQNCHTMSDHAKGQHDFVKSHGNLEMRCAQCHMEHNGDEGIILKDPRQCVSCHGGMSALSKEATILDVPHLSSHPNFRITVKDQSGGVTRVNVDDAQRATDTTPIKLNHAVHLKEGLRGVTGPVTLQCNACHQLSADKRGMVPISFDRHCRDCHSLGFDERLPDRQVPHGDAELVYPTLFAEYAKLLLLDEGKGSGRSADGTRSMPEGTELPSSDKVVSRDAQFVQAEARHAEEDLFTRTGCFLCHTYNEKPLSEQKVDQSHFAITKPHIPNVWMTKARFDHGAHEAVSCESCHNKTRQSTETKDLLLPQVEVCRECHMQDATAGFVESSCASCHVYHVSLEVPREKKQDISGFLHSMTR